MRVFVMHRARGFIGPMVQKSTTKPAGKKGVKSVGSYIVYKKNNP